MTKFEEMGKNLILVIDNDEINLDIAKELLKASIMCEVITTDNDSKAIEILKNQMVRLVLIDIEMSIGIQVLEVIREKNIPVIMFTSRLNKGIMTKTRPLDTIDYIKKPFIPNELISKVKHNLLLNSKNEQIKILIVDDDEMDLMQAQILLEKIIQFKVILVSSVIDAMNILREEKINLVIANTDMSFVNGFRMVELMKDNISLRNIPIFLATASQYPAAMLEIEQSGANGGIQKPFDSLANFEPIIKFFIPSTGV